MDNAVRKMGRLAVIALLAAAAAAPARADVQWMPLDQAIVKAKAERRIILLYLHRPGLGDEKTDEWVAHLDSHEALRELLKDVVVAEQADPKLRAPKMAVCDPGGVPVAEVGFHEYGNMAAQLAQLRQQAEILAKSAKAREEGHPTESLLMRADALLNAGANPRQLYEDVEKLAQREGKNDVMQAAEIGLAMLSSSQGNSRDALRRLREVAAHPARPMLGARAWVLIGHELKASGDRNGAIAAYQSAWHITPRGSQFAEAVRRLLEMMGSAPDSDISAAVAAGAVHLLYPHRAVLAGSVTFSAVAPRNAARVEFFLDDARVAERTRAPFTADIALGAVPHPHVVKAIAFDAQGARLGEDSASLNDRAEAFGVEIVAPREGTVESSAVVEVQPHMPDGDRVQSIDVYWNETKLATLTAPPFRTSLTLPSPRAFGYIRAVGRDATGATAEDAKVINSEGSAAEMRVDAVELYAVVHDRAGHGVQGLTANDFVVKEDGVPVNVAVHSNPNEPITVGIAVDASASMRSAITSVMEYGTEFLRHSMSAGDKTFVVSFAETPELFQPLTSDFEHVSASLFDMRAYGPTALWDAVVFALDQLRSVRGKRALLLFTDGADTGSRTTEKAVIEYAHEVGVPVYAVLVYTGAQPAFTMMSEYGTVSMMAHGTTLDRIARETGGAFIKYPRQQDLPKLFQQVRDDTRDAYLLTFVSPSAKKRGEARKLSVAVKGRRGVVVRAPSAILFR